MGTTCSTLLLLPEGALIAHVGDSRVYRVRNGRIDQLSFDHSLVWELVRRNHLSPEQANIAVPKNVITRSLGPDPNVEVDIEGPLAVEPDDVYLLCSDGLSGPGRPTPSSAPSPANFHPKDACRYLVNLANLRGGHDNITVVIVRIGPWVEPDTADDLPTAPATAKSANGGKKAPSWKSAASPASSAAHKTPAPATVEDHPYRTAECPITDELIDKFSELTRRVQAHAIEQAWSLDWTQFAQYRRERDRGPRRRQPPRRPRSIGEMIALLGNAARFHRKAGQDSAERGRRLDPARPRRPSPCPLPANEDPSRAMTSRRQTADPDPATDLRDLRVGRPPSRTARSPPLAAERRLPGRRPRPDRRALRGRRAGLHLRPRRPPQRRAARRRRSPRSRGPRRPWSAPRGWRPRRRSSWPCLGQGDDDRALRRALRPDGRPGRPRAGPVRGRRTASFDATRPETLRDGAHARDPAGLRRDALEPPGPAGRHRRAWPRSPTRPGRRW